MARNPVHVRDALPDDAGALVALWCAKSETGARASAPSVRSAARAIGNLALDPEQRLLVGTIDEEIVGAAHLLRAPLSPIHEETTVRVSHLLVVSEHRRRGVGHALLGVAAAWADEKRSNHLLVHVSAVAREANRFLARLGLASVATVRGASVAALQDRLARSEAVDAVDGYLMVERLRTLRRRQAGARMGRRFLDD